MIKDAFDDLIDKVSVSEKEKAKLEKEQKERDEARERHINSKIMPRKFPMLWIRDKHTGAEHLYGTDSHDSLWIDEDGNLQYFNFQIGDGTGEEGGYEFIDHCDIEGLGSILEYYLDTKEIG